MSSATAQTFEDQDGPIVESCESIDEGIAAQVHARRQVCEEITIF